jgi:hypothetical protein
MRLAALFFDSVLWILGKALPDDLLDRFWDFIDRFWD